VSSFVYHRPASLDEAVAMLQQGPAPARILNGGTDLMVQLRGGKRTVGAVVSLVDIPGLDALETDADGLRLGARVTLGQALDSELVAERAPLLIEALRRMGNVNVRNRATVVGNICNASPAGDTAGPLLALGASVDVVGPGGERSVLLEDWFTGPGSCCLADDEIAVALRVPRQAGEGRYERLANRPTADCAVASIGLLVDRGEDGAVTAARVTLGAVAPTPCRSGAAETALVGKPLDADTITAAADAAAADAAAIDDVRCSAWYRTEMVRNLTRRGLEALAGEGDPA
jgi:aerobic carbon-monoxide dehydrogenase medium subunit